MAAYEGTMTELQAWKVMGDPRTTRPQSKLRLRLRMYAMMAVADVAAISIGFLAASRIRMFDADPGMALAELAVIAPLYFVIALMRQAYAAGVIHNRWGSVGRALNALALAAASFLFIAFFLKVSQDFSRTVFGVGIVMSAVLLFVCRYLFSRYAGLLLGGDPYKVVNVFDGEVPPSANSHGAIFVQSSDVFHPANLNPATYDGFSEAIEDADRVIVHCPENKRALWTMALKGANVQGEVIAPKLADFKPLGLAHYNGIPTLIVSRGPLGLKDRLIKRVFDIAVAGTALFLLLPLMLMVSGLIYFQDRGPVFFVQTRVGRSNRLFRILKFRSMYVETSDSAGSRSASRSDDRITPIGRIIRATSIDEIPQLINVLLGDMSIVGPRPHALGSTAEDQLFWHIDERYFHRHAIKPGLTGLAQVRGFRGATHRKSDLVNRLQSDLEYLNNWTIWTDVIILIRTVGVVLHKNAY